MLLLDSDPENLLRVATLRKHGYLADTAGTIGEAEKLLNRIDVVVLDADRFGSQVARVLRGADPEVRSSPSPPPCSSRSAGWKTCTCLRTTARSTI